MQAINGGVAYSVDESGWFMKCLADIKTNKACAVIMSSAVMMDVMKAVKAQADQVTGIPFLANAISGAQQAVPLVNPALIVGTLAAAGAAGGAVGTVALAAGIAHAHGMVVSASFVVPPDLLDPSKAELHVEFSPHQK